MEELNLNDFTLSDENVNVDSGSDAPIHLDVDLEAEAEELFDEGNTIYSYPIKTEENRDYQYRFIKEGNDYLVQIVKTIDDDEIEVIKTILTIAQDDLKDMLSALVNRNTNDIFNEFIKEVSKIYCSI